ncbi:MAG: biotin--[acetyl-CoA-carboxylase] ligase [Nitrospirae bacterium]|nr:biotin--[acetyl-CoA-carboxylase] ligase [Nitrospirota bacterium]
MPESILSLLSGNDAFISGQEISAGLGITRAAVWKKILGLRNKGYVIEAVPSKGYRLISAPDLAPEYLLLRIQSSLWQALIVHDSVESTNDLAMSLASRKGISSGTVLIADRQIRGKGRLGRKWESPEGRNIYMSLVIRPELAPRDVTMLTVLAAVAGAHAIQKTAVVPVRIKWPNDLVVSDRKLGGILTEVRADPDRINLAVIGIGVNVNMLSADFSEEIRSLATSVRLATGHPVSRNELIIRMLKEFEHWYGILIAEGKRPLLDAWRKNSSTLGRHVRVAMADQTLAGVAEDIDDNGMLILKMRTGERRNISAGDITFLR